MTKELIERLYASDVASALTNEAARAIEALQARVADQSAQLTRHTNLIDQLQEERCFALGMTGREAIDAAAKTHPL